MVRASLPVTLDLACALEDAGDLFAAGHALLSAGEACAPLTRLLVDIIGPLTEMGAFYIDPTGRRRIDRQAVVDFGVVCCGRARADVISGLTLHEIALHWRRLSAQALTSCPAPGRDFLSRMQDLFPDNKGQTA